MGNNPSRASTASNPQSPASATNSHGPSPFHNARQPRRRESLQALSVKATAAPPSASVESATAHSIVRPVRSNQERPSSRSRAQTVATATINPRLRPQDLLAAEIMGNDHSRPSRESVAPSSHAPPTGGEVQNQLPQTASRNHPSPLSRPVDVPHPSGGRESSPLPAQTPHSASQDDQYAIPSSQFANPPRLPLPIEEEVHTPGSPILAAADVASPIDLANIEGSIPQRATSVLSNTTLDDDEEANADAHAADLRVGPKVPTLIEWKHGGEKVYVTGTFSGWDRKFRLHKGGPSLNKEVLSTVLQIVPGTHHLKFIVDGEMRINDDLPTAVDYTNILVNYIEVSPPPLASEPIDIPSQQQEPAPQHYVPPGVFPPQVLPPSPEVKPVPPPAAAFPTQVPEGPPLSKPVPMAPAPPKKYHSTIPRYLANLDAPEDSSRFIRANEVISHLPPPPSLPMLLSKSILNGNLPMKDDSSVLILPNHTVLNHLATSSIRHNVLATSATTRYKKKFLSTIMFKPTSETGD